jgi:PA14 domain
MRHQHRSLLAIGFISLTVAAAGCTCTAQSGSGARYAQDPAPGPAPAPAPAPAPGPAGPATAPAAAGTVAATPTPAAGPVLTPTPHYTPIPGLTPPGTGGKKIGRISVGQAVGRYNLPDGTTVPIANGETPFGGGTETPDSLRGTVYFIPVGTTKFPDVTSLKPAGVLFTKTLNIPPRDFTSGFPGIDNRTEWFAIRYESAFNVATEATYALRLVSDDGTIVYIDDMKILDNDGLHPAQMRGQAVHLVAGKHTVRVDYFQGPRATIALQLLTSLTDQPEKPFSTSF